jgi:hypothetical protein
METAYERRKKSDKSKDKAVKKHVRMVEALLAKPTVVAVAVTKKKGS